MAYLAGEGDALTGTGLRPFVQEHNLGTVDHIRLNAAYVDVPLDFTNPHHIVIRRSPNLHPIYPPTIPNQLNRHIDYKRRRMEELNEPEQGDDPCGGLNSKSRRHCPCSPSRRGCIRSCWNRHESHRK